MSFTQLGLRPELLRAVAAFPGGVDVATAPAGVTAPTSRRASDLTAAPVGATSPDSASEAGCPLA